MIKDSTDGKIDLILTKSVSRFARNTVDSLTTVRELKDKGVEIYFEKENIWTMDSKGELLITIMSSLAQEESRSISENCKWGIQKYFQEGRVRIPYSIFLGYEKGANGSVINEEQAATVRYIFTEFNKGNGYNTIKNKLINKGCLNARGKVTWTSTSVKSILTNEKYAGNAILQKTYSDNFLTKKRIMNDGILPKYCVENSYPAIVSQEVFNLAQKMVEEIKLGRGHSGHLFSGFIKCGCCGDCYGPKVWDSTNNKKVIWQCNSRYKKARCKGPHFYKEEIETIVRNALIDLLDNKNLYLLKVEKLLVELEQIEIERTHLRIKLDSIDDTEIFIAVQEELNSLGVKLSKREQLISFKRNLENLTDPKLTDFNTYFKNMIVNTKNDYKLELLFE